MKILIIAPHPDDDVIGCGGVMAYHIKHNDAVCVLYMTSGESGDMHISPEALALTRESEARTALSILGVSDCTFFHLPDGYITYGKKNIEQMTEYIRVQQPNRIYIPHKEDEHPDHQATHAITMEAIRRSGGNAFGNRTTPLWTVSEVYAYEVWSPIAHPTIAIDITPYMDKKISAIQQHVTQLKNVAYDEAVKGLNKYRGVLSKNGEFAECFSIIKTHFI